MNRNIFTLIIALIILPLASAFAQENADSVSNDGNRRKWLNDVKDYKYQMLEREAQMTPEQAEMFFPLYQEMENKVFMVNLEARQREMQVSDNFDDATDEDFKQAAQALSDVKVLEAEIEKEYYPQIQKLIDQLAAYAEEWKDIPMLAKTHGQPASPTRLGKEIMVFVYRLRRQLDILKACAITAKFGGATGNYNAHHVAYPEFDWKEFGNKFVAEKLGLEREEYTTQISNYDNLGAIFDAMKRINTIMIDMNRDFWQYISMEYFKQKIKAGEVGSSAMPHKVNPIDFENAEGNLGMANAIFEHLSSKLPVSRLQRDLTDSTVLRNIGVPFGHTIIAIQSSLKGLGKLLLNEHKIYEDLDNCWSVVAEAIQTILRREAYPNPYEALKALTRTNQAINEASIKNFIETLEVSEDIKKELRAITPHNYTGI